jgi:hypothetical protein
VLLSWALSLVVVPSAWLCTSTAGRAPRPMAAATEEQRRARVGSTARRCAKPQLAKGFQGHHHAYGPALRGARAHCRSLDGQPGKPTAPVALLLPGRDAASSPCGHAWSGGYVSYRHDRSQAWSTRTPVVAVAMCGHAVLAACQDSKDYRHLLPAGRRQRRPRTPNN